MWPLDLRRVSARTAIPRDSILVLLAVAYVDSIGQTSIKTVLSDPLTWGSLKAVDLLPVPGNMVPGEMISAPFNAKPLYFHFLIFHR